jgi:hypothetical protein
MVTLIVCTTPSICLAVAHFLKLLISLTFSSTVVVCSVVNFTDRSCERIVISTMMNTRNHTDLRNPAIKGFSRCNC